MDFRRKNIDLVGKMPLWFGISLALILVGLISLASFGMNLGIDFKGGGQFQYRIPANQRPVAAGADVALIGRVRTALEAQGLRTLPQIAGGDTLVIKTDARGQGELRGQQQRIQRAIAPIFAGGKTETGATASLAPIGQQFVGPVIGEELKRNAILGVILGVSLIALWIYIRYNFDGEGTRYAVAGIVALLHDVLVLLGIFSLIGYYDPRIEIDGAFIAALLTVVGYSINDSVVIFDRIRENLRLRRKERYEKVINDSLLETMSRSINTGLTVIIMLFTLLWFGGESIYSFVLAMLIGIASGLYSSIFNASMVLVAWHRWDEKKAAQSRITGVTRSPRLATAGATSSTRPPSTRSSAVPRVAMPVTTTPRRGFASTTSSSATASNVTTSSMPTSSVSVVPTPESSDTTSFASPESAAVTDSATTNYFDNANENATQILVEQDGGATVSDALDAADEAEEASFNAAKPHATEAERNAARALRASKKARAKRRY